MITVKEKTHVCPLAIRDRATILLHLIEAKSRRRFIRWWWLFCWVRVFRAFSHRQWRKDGSDQRRSGSGVHGAYFFEDVLHNDLCRVDVVPYGEMLAVIVGALRYLLLQLLLKGVVADLKFGKVDFFDK